MIRIALFAALVAVALGSLLLLSIAAGEAFVLHVHP